MKIDVQAFFPEEKIKFQREGFLVKNFLNAKTGTMVITDKRIAFIEKKITFKGHEIIEIANQLSKVNQPKIKVNVPFEELKSFSWPKRIDFLIENKNGEKFKLRPIEEQEILTLIPKI